MILLILSLIYLGFWNPSWRALAILSAVTPFIQIAVLVGLNGGAATDTMAGSVIINTLIFAVLGAIVVGIAERMRKRDADELEMLARLTQKSQSPDQ